MSRAVAAVVLAVLAAAAITAYMTLQRQAETAEHGGLLVLVSFPNLVDDIKPLLCSGDQVRSIAPPGIDPHSYQLTLSDFKLLRKASLVITTGHAPFEVEIEKKLPESKVIVIPKVVREAGGIILLNPDTGQENLHMPIYDPRNYRIFIRFVAEKMASMNPRCKSHYLGEAEKIIARIEQLMRSAPHLNVTAVASAPAAQYAVEWMGIHVVKLLVKEHGLTPTPEDLRAVESLLAQRRAGLAVILVDGEGRPLTPADRKLEVLAEKYGVPVVKVPAPFLPGSIIEKLETVVGEVERVAG